jgi:hypothetical protein
MNQKIKNAWEWTKEHKTEICCTAIAAFSGFIVYKSYIRGNEVVDAIRNVTKTPTVEIAKGVSDFDGMMLQVNDMYKLSELGKLGEQIREFAPDIPEEIDIWGLIDHTEIET